MKIIIKISIYIYKEMSFYEKYIKYKQKYIILKNQLKGGDYSMDYNNHMENRIKQYNSNIFSNRRTLSLNNALLFDGYQNFYKENNLSFYSNKKLATLNFITPNSDLFNINNKEYFLDNNEIKTFFEDLRNKSGGWAAPTGILSYYKQNGSTYKLSSFFKYKNEFKINNKLVSFFYYLKKDDEEVLIVKNIQI